MPQTVDTSMPLTFPEPKYLTLAGWKRGVISLIEKSHLPKDALEKAQNIFLVEDGQPAIRPGVGVFANFPTGLTGVTINCLDYFDFSGVIHLVMSVSSSAGAGLVNTSIYRSVDDGQTWDICTGAGYPGATGLRYPLTTMNQNGGYLYITDGRNKIRRYDGTTVIQTYTALTTPAAPTVAETGLAGTGYTYYYKTAAVNQVGYSAASPASTVVQTSVPRSGWDTTTNYAVITPDAFQATQTRTDIYISENNVDYFYLGSTTVTGGTFKDDGTSIPVPGTSAPTGNTTQGPRVEELTNVGSRMFGVRDTDNRYRIWFTGSGSFSGSFSTAYDGGYLDWQPGGKLIPKKVVEYRDGKGTPLATVWCDSGDGQGGIIQMSLDTLTIGDVSITVPSAYLLPGSRGTPAPGSVVNVLNDYMFYNSQGIYNLGTRAQYLNLLSTDEASANIRPNVKQVNRAAETGIASAYFDARVYFSYPRGTSTDNNYTMIFDTERKAWLPEAFTRGFRRFLRYKGNDKVERLLAYGGSRSDGTASTAYIQEISSGINGDFGAAFQTLLTTGLYSVTRNRFEFQYVEEAEMEFSNPAGDLLVELLGIDRVRGLQTIAQKTLTSPTIHTETGWDSFSWDIEPWDDPGVVSVYSESSTKRYMRVQKELNAVQWRVTTNALDAQYIARTLQTWGTETTAGKPRNWFLS